MKTVGIICEYNPFHKGHRKQIDHIRHQFGEDTTIVGVMSGNFVQRGEPALIEKSKRAEAAVCAGVDLILELPVTKALSSAEGFADGGIAALDAIGCVDAVCFGSESGALSAIRQSAEILLTDAFSELLRAYLQAGCSFATARQQALQQLLPDAPIMKPNDILAVEYCKALLRRNSAIEPMTVQRSGDYHAQTAEQTEPSATALRLLPSEEWNAFMPNEAYEILRHAPQYHLAAGERAMLARLRTISQEEMSNIPFGSEGLWRKLYRACHNADSLEEIIAQTKSKRYARSRIMRMIMCAYLGISDKDMAAPIPYLRVLAANSRGKEILHRCKKTATLPIFNAGAKPSDPEYYQLECRCAELFALFAANNLQTLTENQRRTVWL